MLGEHTDEVLRQLLGLGDEQIAELLAVGIARQVAKELRRDP